MPRSSPKTATASRTRTVVPSRTTTSTQVPDDKDKCPNEPEDADQFDDEDGCPEADNDKDGISDLNDACPNAAEDGQGKRPKDGCPSTTEDSRRRRRQRHHRQVSSTSPRTATTSRTKTVVSDPDNDADGIPDNFDNCPNDAEDPDGFEDEDGCPDPDNDKDGFLDAADRCPTAGRDAERHQGRRRLPGSGRRGRAAGSGAHRADERVGFVSRGGKLQVKDSSAKFVNLVALIMKGHPEIAKVRIEVHAEGVGQTETQKRADAVRDFLVSKGVDAARLVPVGAGPGPSRIDFLIDRPRPAGRSRPAGPGHPTAGSCTAASGRRPARPRNRPPRHRAAQAGPAPASAAPPPPGVR